MIGQLLRRWSGTPDEVARKIQAVGLIRSADLIRRALGKPPPAPRDMPHWIGDILAAVTRRLCAYDDEAMPSPEDCEALDAATDFLYGMPAETQREFQSLLVLVEVAPFLFGPRRRRFTELSEDDQDAALRAWEQSSLSARKMGFNAVKSLAMMGYWSRPDVWPSIGYSVVDNPGVPEPQKQMWRDIEGDS